MKKSDILIRDFERAIDNCYFYMKKPDILRTVTEIEYSRGLYHVLDLYGFLHLVDDFYIESFHSFLHLKLEIFKRYDNNLEFMELFSTFSKFYVDDQ